MEIVLRLSIDAHYASHLGPCTTSIRLGAATQGQHLSIIMWATRIYIVRNSLCKCRAEQNEMDSLFCKASRGCSANLRCSLSLRPHVILSFIRQPLTVHLQRRLSTSRACEPATSFYSFISRQHLSNQPVRQQSDPVGGLKTAT